MTEDLTPEEYRTAARVLDAVGSSLNLADSHTASKDLLRLAERVESDAYITELAKHMFETRQAERQSESFDGTRIEKWGGLVPEQRNSIIRNVQVLLAKLKADGRYVESPEPVAGKRYERCEDVPPGHVYRRVTRRGEVGFTYYYYNIIDEASGASNACSYPEGHSMPHPSEDVIIHAVTTGEVVPL